MVDQGYREDRGQKEKRRIKAKGTRIKGEAVVEGERPETKRCERQYPRSGA